MDGDILLCAGVVSTSAQAIVTSTCAMRFSECGISNVKLLIGSPHILSEIKITEVRDWKNPTSGLKFITVSTSTQN